MLKLIVLVFSLMVLSGCASTSQNTFETLADSCHPNDHSSCYPASNMVWNISQSELKPCSGEQRLCVAEAETQEEAMDRLRSEAAELNKIACIEGSNAEACVRVGTALAIKAGDLPLDNYRHVADKAEFFFKKGCDLGSVKGCVFRGSSYRVGG